MQGIGIKMIEVENRCVDLMTVTYDFDFNTKIHYGLKEIEESRFDNTQHLLKDLF